MNHHRAEKVIASLVILNHCHEYKSRDQSKTLKVKLDSIKAQLNNSIKAKLVSSDVRCMICKSHTVTQRVKSLSEIIVISGHQLKSQENIQVYLTINEESNLFILALVTLFISGLDHPISLFWSKGFTDFLRVHAKVLDSDPFDQYLKYSV